MKIRAGSVRSQFQKCNSFKAQTDHRAFLRIAIAFIPEAAFGLEQVRMISRESIETGTAQTVLAFDDEAQTNRQFAERLLISLDRGQARQQIAFTIGGSPGVEFAVND